VHTHTCFVLDVISIFHLDELIPSAHTESSVTSSSRSAPTRDLMVNLLYHLADHLSRGFLSGNDQFRARRLK